MRPIRYNAAMNLVDRARALSDRDLTACSIPSGVLGLALPMIAAGLLHAAQGLVDLYFVGDLGKAAVAAVGMATTAVMALVTVFVGLNTATVALVSRAVGAGDRDEAGQVAGQVFTLTVLLSVLVGAAGYAAADALLRILGASPEVIGPGGDYLRVIFGGVFFLCAAFVMNGVFQGAGDTVTPLVLGAFTTAVNVVLTPALIQGWGPLPALGVRGSAWATVFARAVALAAGMAVLARRKRLMRIRAGDLAPRIATVWRVVRLTVPSAVQMGLRMWMNLVLMVIVARFGAAAVAGYTIGMRLRMIGLFPAFGFGGAAATMTGQNLGAAQPDRARRSTLTALLMGFGCSAAAGAVFFVFARPVVAAFNDHPEVVETGAVFLRITVFGLLTAPVGIILSRALNGAGDAVSPLVITLGALWGFQAPAAVLLSGVESIGGMEAPGRALFAGLATGDETGVWYAMVAASVLQAAATAAWWATGRWRRVTV